MRNDVSLQYQAARDIALRSRSGVFAYPVIFGVIAFFSPYHLEHPLFSAIIGSALLLATAGRAISCWYFDRFYHYNKRYWHYTNATSLIGLALAWGLLSMMSIYYYAWDWVTMATCLSAAAFSAGVAATLSIDYLITIVYLLVMFLPSLVVTIVLDARESLIVTFLFSIYLAYLAHIARRLNKEYWSALRNVHLLKARARELDTKNMELEALAYSISHDLRTPLRSLDGFSELLAEDAGEKLNDTERDYLSRIRKSAQHMGVLIDDLLKLSRISRAGYAPCDVNLSYIVQEKINELKRQYPERRVEVEIEPDIKVHGDTSLLDIAINSLISNAWKYSAKKEQPKIRFASTRVNNEVAYYIKDNGVGFDARYVNKLFTPFQRLHHMNDYPGNGIGLATVKRIMQRHGGRVWANGKVDKGATFYFTLEGEEAVAESETVVVES